MSRFVIGVAINAVGIVVGSIFGLKRKEPISAANASFLKVAMGAMTVAIGLQLTWKHLNGSFGTILKQFFIVLISMSLGKLLGKLLRLQKMSNSIGRFATDKMSKPGAGKEQFNNGFVAATVLACASPLAVLASVDEGLTGLSLAFVIKALMDGLAAMAFVSIFGWGVLLSALPVLAFQGTIYLAVRAAAPFLQEHDLVDSILATNGMLVFSVSLIILNLKKIELTDYLPSLAVAPVITYFWR